MPFPKKHVAQLKKGLEIHKERILALKTQIELMEKEINIHEVVIRLAESKNFFASLDNVMDDKRALSEFKKNPKEFFKQREIPIPQESDMTVQSNEVGISEINLFSHDGPYEYKLSWNEQSGFNIESTKSK